MRLFPSSALLAGLVAVSQSPSVVASDHHGGLSKASLNTLRPRAKLKLANLPRFKTEPKFIPVAFDYIRRAENRSLVAPGYLFFTITRRGGPVSRGAQIMDQDGTLIWHSEVTGCQNLHVCDYMDSRGDHLCLHQQSWEYAHILDNTYTPVTKHYPSDNGHEMRVVNDGRTVLRVVQFIRRADLTPYTGDEHGWVIDTCFEETDIRSGKRVFLWCPLEHINIWETTLWIRLDGPLGEKNSTMRGRKAGHGTKNDPWDFFHINSMDKADGDYIISGRHCDVLIKIAGPDNNHGLKPGSIIWRLGGQLNDFKKNFTFTRQHSVRFHSVNDTETVISIFNNAWEGDIDPSADFSDGQIIKVNNKTMKATLLHSYPHPDGAISEGRGNTQLLPNGNVFNAYGRFPDYLENQRNGTVLDHVRYSQWDFDRSPNIDYHKSAYSYRVFKDPWVGKPAQPPKLLAYSRTCSIAKRSPLMAYVSWNGATEVTQWRFYISSTSDQGPWLPAGTFEKTGFETQAHLSGPTLASVVGFIPFVLVEALDADGKVLSSKISRTFVPKSSKKITCGKFGCREPKRYKYPAQDSQSCDPGRYVASCLTLVLLLLLLEWSTYVFGQFICRKQYANSWDQENVGNQSNGGIPSGKEEHVALRSDQDDPEAALIQEKETSGHHAG